MAWFPSDLTALMKAKLIELLTKRGEVAALIIDGWSAAWSRIYYDRLLVREFSIMDRGVAPSLQRSRILGTSKRKSHR